MNGKERVMRDPLNTTEEQISIIRDIVNEVASTEQEERFKEIIIALREEYLQVKSPQQLTKHFLQLLKSPLP